MTVGYTGTGATQNQGFGTATATLGGTTAGSTGHKTSDIEVSQARQALDQLKQETAAELGLTNYQGYRGDIPSRQNGAVGGHMVRKMIRFAESQLSGGTTTR